MKTKTNKTLKKILSLALCLALVLSCVPVMALGADGVSYINENGEQQTYTGAYTEVTSDLTTWSNGWYVVKGDVKVSTYITVSGTVNLILTDNSSFESVGIRVTPGNTLCIYSQSLDENTMGKLTADTYYAYSAGIGGYSGSCGTVIINGGIVVADAVDGPGIGSYSNPSKQEYGNCGTVTINGGIVTATGGTDSAGIGSVEVAEDREFPITINGGEVTANGNGSGAGIGGGNYVDGGIVTINGGTVTAIGGSWGAAGIGGGNCGNGGTVTINDGVVTAIGGNYYTYNGAGIGGGLSGDGGTVTISGGIVNAKGGNDSEGIGAGREGDGGTLVIDSGMVFQNGIGAVYGDEFIIENDFRIEDDYTLTINEGQTVTVAEGVMLVNRGNIVNNGLLINSGVIEDVNYNILSGYASFGGEIYRAHNFVKGYCTICGDACTSHEFENGFCKNECANVYEPATEVSDKYDVDGDGYTDQVYEIANAGQLYWFAGLVNGTLTDIQQNYRANAVLTADIVVNENVLNDDFSLNGDGSNFRVWTPIGAELEKQYSGVIDGKGHIISGLYINDISIENVGLMGYLGGSIRNIGIEDTYFFALRDVGAICGWAGYRALIENCYVKATLKDDWSLVGGFVGSLTTVNKKTVTIKNSYFSGRALKGKVFEQTGLAKVINSYYNSDLYSGSVQGIGKTTEEFASGEVAYLLNSSSPDGVWKQTVGEDAYPNFTGEKVYYGYSCKTEEFVGASNEKAHPDKEHYDENGYCAICKMYQPATLNANNYYEIYNVGQLYWFAEEVSSYNNEWNNVYNAILMNDIVINENLVDENGNLTENTENLRKWLPISNGSNTTFNGVFDGNYHTISGVYIDDADLSYSALFGSLQNGAIKNLGITDSYINGERGSAFAGWSNGTIENCFVTDTVIKGESTDSFVVSYHGTNQDFDYPCITKNSYSTALVYENGTQVDGALVNENISERVYYLADSDNGNGGKTVEQFANGEVAYLLGSPWGQEIEKDLLPVWNGKTVYMGYDCGGTDAYYSNTELLGENDKNHIHSEWTYSNTYGVHQRYICTREGCPQYQVIETGNCSGGTATCQEAATCNVCHYSYGDYDYNNHTSTKTYMTEGDENGHKLFHECCDVEISTTPHSYEGYDFDTHHHWNACECGYVNEAVKESHTFDGNGFCTVCDGYESAPIVYNEESYSNVAEIGNAGQLFWYAENWNACPVYDEENDEYYTESAGAILVNDIDLNPGYTFYEDGSYSADETAENYSPVLREWSPIKGFAWVDFDGQGYTIRGLYINTPEERNVGMFASNDYYTIKNITLTNGFVHGSDNTAAIVAYNSGNVENCHSDITVKGNGSIGGIVAYHLGSEVKNCSNSGSVIIYGSSSATGGIVGNVYDYSAITNCYNTGYIKGGIRVGGIVGDAGDATITNCYNTGLILSNFSDAHAISGGGTIENCYDLSTEDNGADKKTKEQFESGEVAYLLQQGNTEQVWGQDSNQDGSTPILDSTGLYKVATVGETGNYSVANIGDTNADGTVDVLDYQELVNTILADDHEQIEKAEYDDIIRYDLDGDGALDVLDASVMHLFINGFTTVDVYAVGDYDLNGVAFEEADILAMGEAMGNPGKLATHQKYACDLNADGKVDYDDLNTLTNMFPLYFVGEE